MNYFDLFDLPLSFNMDEAILAKKYYALSRHWHPDNFSLQDRAKQDLAMEKTAEINEGYRVLKSEQARIRHLLDIHDAAPQEGKDVMPQHFLMEMMNLNEAIMDYKMEPDEATRANIQLEIESFRSSLREKFSSVTTTMDLTKPQVTELEAVKEYYLKSKYLKRLLENLDSREVEI